MQYKFKLFLLSKLLLASLPAVLLWNSPSVFAQSNIKLQINTELPAKIGDNFIALHPDSIVYEDEAKSKRWNYEQGIVLDAFYRLYKYSGNKKYYEYAKKNLDYYIQNDGTIATYNLKEFNLDNVTPGRAVLYFYNATKDEKYKKAADTLREQLRQHPRTQEGSFWHKAIYPNQVWLDGLYMAQPFYAMYASEFNDKEALKDVIRQLVLIYNHAKDSSSGLLYHAWDESRKMPWSNPQTGTSPNFWGRAAGWYAMALVDVLDYIPTDYPERKELIKILNSFSADILKYRDEKTKLWFQILNKPEDKRNYTEASASLMFIYAFAKGANNGYIDSRFFNYAEESFKGVIDNLISSPDGKTFNLNRVCKVGGLGGKPYRDGSLDYYFSEPVRVNDFKGYGPLLLASLEIARGLSNHIGEGKTVGLDYYFNNEWKGSKRYHYVWEDSAFSGFSEFGNIFKQSGAEIKSITGAPLQSVLDSLSVYIIVDPDTPAETDKPNYISDNDIASITEWVKKGGVLLLLANDSANCEFKHLNLLSDNFGIHFNEDSWNRVTGKNFDMGKFDSLPSHPLFKNVSKLYLKEISSIAISKNAEPVLTKDGRVFMASANFGKGFVFTVGDPWIYNEYIDNRKLPKDFTNYNAAKNLVLWLLEKCTNY